MGVCAEALRARKMKRRGVRRGMGLRWSGDGSGEEVEGAFGDEIIGDPAAEGAGRSVVGGLGVDLDHGFAVGRYDLGEHAPLPCFSGGWEAMDANGERTAAAVNDPGFTGAKDRKVT